MQPAFCVSGGMRDGMYLCHTQGEGGPVQEGGKHRVHVILDQHWDAAVQHSILCSWRPAITCTAIVLWLSASLLL